ncbi:MAG TPA: hypothetical protein V6C97_35795 [Oculatellaceae cyanobacterium]
MHRTHIKKTLDTTKIKTSPQTYSMYGQANWFALKKWPTAGTAKNIRWNPRLDKDSRGTTNLNPVGGISRSG